MRASLAVVAAVVALGLVPSGSFARSTAPPSINLTSVTFTPFPNAPGFCTPVWHFTVQGVTGSKRAPWQVEGMLNPPVESFTAGFFTFQDNLTRHSNGKSLAVTDTNGADAIPEPSGTSRDYQLTLFDANHTAQATSQTLTVSDPATSAC